MARDDRYALAAITAQDLAGTLDRVAAKLPLAPKSVKPVKRAVFAVAAVMAPAIRSATDVAAIGKRLAAATALLRVDVPPTDAAPVLYAAAGACVGAAPRFASPARTIEARLARMLAACCEAAFLGEAFVAEAETEFGDRQSAAAARKRIADAIDAAIDRVAQNTGQAVTDLLGHVARTVSEHIARVAADLKPVVRIQTPRSAPSTALAWALYGDPARAPELVARNKVATPLFMPVTIDALAPESR